MSVGKHHLALVSGRIEQVFETPATAVNGPGAWPNLSVTCAQCGAQFEYAYRGSGPRRTLCSRKCINRDHRAKITPEQTEQWLSNAREVRRAKREALRPREAVVSLPGEEWRPVLGLEETYEVSSHGRVRSLDRIVKSTGDKSRGPYEKTYKGKLLSPHPGHGGYLAVYTPLGSQRVHVLVAEAFHGSRPEGQLVRHLNGNSLDNRPENLAYGTHLDNIHDMIRHGRGHWQEQTHCVNGHEYTTGNNVYERRRGDRMYRRCRTCTNDQSRARYRQRQDAKRPAA